MAGLDQLTSHRSDKALEVLAFLSESAAALDVTPWIWPHTGRSILGGEECLGRPEDAAMLNLSEFA